MAMSYTGIHGQVSEVLNMVWLRFLEICLGRAGIELFNCRYNLATTIAMNYSHTVMQSSLYQTSADSPIYKMNVLGMWTQTTEMRL